MKVCLAPAIDSQPKRTSALTVNQLLKIFWQVGLWLDNIKGFLLPGYMEPIQWGVVVFVHNDAIQHEGNGRIFVFVRKEVTSCPVAGSQDLNMVEFSCRLFC